jgi:potassium channel subfamily K
MSSAFGVIAVAESWRAENITKAANGILVGTDVEDPKWLVAINGLSLAFSIIANISLLLSMANRLPFTISQPLTIISFFSSSVMLIVITTLASHNNFLTPGSSLSGSFYFACLSAALSLLLSILLMFTFYYAKVRHEIPPDLSETLTLPQRTLMGQSLGFIFYLTAGAAVFSHIEGWRLTDGVYWATVTLLTIGFGDLVPTTHTGRSLIIPFATTGIVMIGLVIGSIGTLVLDRGAKKMFARMTVKARAKKIQVASREERPDTATSQPQPESTTSDKNEHPHHVHLANEKVEFDLMREVQADVAKSQQFRLIMISTVAIFMLWLLGAAVFWSTEKASQSWS